MANQFGIKMEVQMGNRKLTKKRWYKSKAARDEAFREFQGSPPTARVVRIKDLER